MNDTGQQNIADPLFTLECPNGQPIKTWIFRAFSPEIVLADIHLPSQLWSLEGVHPPLHRWKLGGLEA